MTVTVGPSQAASPTPRWTRTVINATSRLTPGQSWSTDRITLAFQSDGNLVLYDHDGSLRWQSGTAGRGNVAIFQSDGNLVVHAADGTAVWASQTQGHNGARLALDRDGVVRIYFGADVLWSSN
ncbi:hypothetical protein [Streptomyces hyaluromycini]|uniref:hypothetical protein n=1 Tax=Streptomyces hyaluromycini TaxID=1377993 RepID=UPI00142DD2F5|nr:hypothetical protein [Streptomyces hyaluromycini]